jgi:large subunit ribosomal protein L13
VARAETPVPGQVTGALCIAAGSSLKLPPFHAPDPFQGFKMKTVFAKPETVRRDWYVVDASGRTLGRLASVIAFRLRGKHKPIFTPHVDCGDHIIVVNAERISVTGDKLRDKMYHHHTGYMGNLKSIALGKLLQEHPERAIEFAVKGMLPKTILGRKMFKKLHVFAGTAHPHAAQQPKPLELS